MNYDHQNLFAKILRKEIPSVSIYEDDVVYAFLDIMPISQGHTLVVVKEPVALLEDLTPASANHLMATLQKLAGQIKSAMHCGGINILLNDGPVAGQEIPHLHFHIIPRHEGDGFGLKYGPQGRPKRTPQELQNTAELIKSSFRP